MTPATTRSTSTSTSRTSYVIDGSTTRAAGGEGPERGRRSSCRSRGSTSRGTGRRVAVPGARASLLAARLRWRTSTPRGSPVEPEVKITYAGVVDWPALATGRVASPVSSRDTFERRRSWAHRWPSAARGSSTTNTSRRAAAATAASRLGRGGRVERHYAAPPPELEHRDDQIGRASAPPRRRDAGRPRTSSAIRRRAARRTAEVGRSRASGPMHRSPWRVGRCGGLFE